MVRKGRNFITNLHEIKVKYRRKLISDAEARKDSAGRITEGIVESRGGRS